MKRSIGVGCALAMVVVAGSALAADWVKTGPSEDTNFPDATPWSETAVVLPAYPKDGSLVEFQVGARSSNRFFVDGTSISRGDDGVVRYTVVIKAPSGATNVIYEGLRCETGELRQYAFGSRDGTWLKARGAVWHPVENKRINSYQAVLNRDFFCPGGASIANAEEGRDALRRGLNPNAPAAIRGPD